MKVYAQADGLITAIRMTPAEEASDPVTGALAASVLEIDPDTNAALAANLAVSTDPYRLVGTTLTRNGVAVVVAADGENAQVRALASSAISDLTTYIGLAAPTAAQRLAYEKLVARIVRYQLRQAFGL